MNLEKKKGVFVASKKDGSIYYRTSLTYQKKHISLGSYDTAELAEQAYLEGSRILKDTQLRILDYSPDTSILRFEKWVSLVNVRDNGLYFSNPIYLYPKFFHYYISPSYELKFDLDDLFYYSSHKIMKRQGHMFVADYGMQLNILNRYGIKNYSVKGRDFLFLNGDDTDFRYHNIKIINRYQGVTQQTDANSICYKAKIHLRNDFVIGYYDTEEEAAIAYNKAIDTITKQGILKQFNPNYLEHITNREYAKIYSTLSINPKLFCLANTSF